VIKNRTIAIIPARGGSKGIKRKNLLEVDSVPLIGFSIIAATGCERINEVFVSSDDNRILKTAEKYGATALKRPRDLATDTATTESVIHNVLKDTGCCHVVLIQPTSPMLKTEDILNGFNVYDRTDVDSVFSGVRTNDMLVWDADSMYPLNYDPRNRGQRQTRRRQLFIENGAFYIFMKSKFLYNQCRLYGKIACSEMPYWRSFQVDESDDINNIKILMTTKV